MTEIQETERSHYYHAEATVLKGQIELPIVREIKPQAHSYLRPEGGYLSQRAGIFRTDELISYHSGYTHVAGNRSHKPGEGWSTMTTFAVEHLNVLEVLTADRVVGQIITVHPLEGHVPSISFLGTRFENLRIAGHPVNLKLNHSILGVTPANNKPYGLDSGLKGRIASQYDRIRKNKELPADQLERYHHLSSRLGSPDEFECSLVDEASGDFPGPSGGHIIHIPHFGLISLATVKVTHQEVKEDREIRKKTTVTLTMVDLKLGCPVVGSMMVAVGHTNGSTYP